ncbi:MAG: EAL domain-containing protein [Phyllobacteriaceae bacterium]|nr:EAL domain-containing protein [Phyllobacteriaceae bacterium]
MANPADRRIVVDEVGLRYAKIGPVRLRTIHQPLFAVRDASISLCGVRAYLRATSDGAMVAPTEFFASVAPTDRQSTYGLLARLHMENRLNAGVDDPRELDCWIGIDNGAGIDAADDQIDICAEIAGDDVERTVCELMNCDALTGMEINRLADRAHAHGMRVCIDALGSANEAARDVGADIVKMRGSTFRNLARVRKAADLIAIFIEGWRNRDVSVLVEGIETRSHLVTALDAGATHVQGFLLGTPKLAGTIIDDQMRGVIDLLYGDGDLARLAT